MKKHILTVLIGLNLALIWGNSLMDAQNSNAVSRIGRASCRERV